MDIGSRLKEVRRGKENQQQIAELLGTTQQQVSKYENNVQEIPCRHIITLARHFDVSADYLLCLTDDRSKLWETQEKTAPDRRGSDKNDRE